jgi:hypothetical protein
MYSCRGILSDSSYASKSIAVADGKKTKAQLVNEITALRQRVATLEVVMSERRETEKALRESEELHRPPPAFRNRP